MQLLKLALYVSVLLIYYSIGKRLGLTAITYSRFNHKSVYGAGFIFALIYVIESFPFSNSITLPTSIIILSCLSFLDDLRPISPLFRLVVHLIFGCIASFFILKIGVDEGIAVAVITSIFISFYANVNNFMDGINGMMIANNILILITLLLINFYCIEFTDHSLLFNLILGGLVFSVFNFRRRALLISGDVGSIVLGFILIVSIFSLYFKTKNIFVFALTITFSVETISTLMSRLFSNKNILQSHKEHLYEVLVIKNKIPALQVSSIYAIVQLMFGILVLTSFYYEISNEVFYVILISYILIYMYLKSKFLNYAKGN